MAVFTMSKKLLKSTSMVAVITMLSRILGFVRDLVMAQVFGAGPAFDAFVIAFKIPNFLRRLFGEGAFAQAFIPILAEYRAKKTPEEVRDFLNRVAGTLTLAVLVIVLIAEIITPLLIILFAPGFLKDPGRFHMSRVMLQITFPYLLLITLTAFTGAILNTYGRFAVAAFAPVMLNVAMIAVAYFWAPHTQTPIYILAWGVIFGGILQLLVTAPFLLKLKLLPMPKLGFKDAGVRRVMKLMVPAIFGVSVAQVSLLIDSFFASFLPQGSISWLYYSDRFIYLPVGVIGLALSIVVMPHLARHHNENSPRDFSITLDWALRCLLIIGLPSAVGLFVLAGPLLATLIHHGEFGNRDVIMTARSLMAFAVGVPAVMAVKILASAFYSRQDIRTPVKIAVMAMGVGLIMNLVLIFPLKHAGLALATAIGSMFNASFLLWHILKEKIYMPLPKWKIFLTRLLLSNFVMGLLIAWLAGGVERWLNWSPSERYLHLFLILAVGGISYGVMLLLSGVRIRDFQPPPSPAPEIAVPGQEII